MARRPEPGRRAALSSAGGPGRFGRRRRTASSGSAETVLRACFVLWRDRPGIDTDSARTRHTRAASVRTPWVGGGLGRDQSGVPDAATACPLRSEPSSPGRMAWDLAAEQRRGCGATVGSRAGATYAGRASARVRIETASRSRATSPSSTATRASRLAGEAGAGASVVRVDSGELCASDSCSSAPRRWR